MVTPSLSQQRLRFTSYELYHDPSHPMRALAHLHNKELWAALRFNRAGKVKLAWAVARLCDAQGEQAVE
jgi:hypothetical protein